MRREDTDNAFQLVLEAYSSGILFEDYIKSCTIIVNSESDTNVANGDNEENESIEDSFSDAPETITDEIRVAVAVKHCEPDCSQCREAAATGETVVTAVTETITEEIGVTPATGEAAVSGESPAADMPKRPPVCHFLWRAEECTVEGCQKSHPPPCNTLSRCLELDQDLPRWKSTGCKKWHGRTKSSRPKPRKAKKFNGNTQKVPSRKSRPFHGSRPQTMGLPWPQPPAQAWLHTLEEPKPHTPLEIDLWNQLHQMGNDQAARTPLTGGGIEVWGNGRIPYNQAAKGLGPAKLSQFELEMLALMSRVLA